MDQLKHIHTIDERVLCKHAHITLAHLDPPLSYCAADQLCRGIGVLRSFFPTVSSLTKTPKWAELCVQCLRRTRGTFPSAFIPSDCECDCWSACLFRCELLLPCDCVQPSCWYAAREHMRMATLHNTLKWFNTGEGAR